MSATAENTDARKPPKKPGKAKPADAGSVIRTGTGTAAHRLNEAPPQKGYGTARMSASTATGLPIIDLLLPDPLAATIGLAVPKNEIDGRCLDLNPGDGSTCR